MSLILSDLAEHEDNPWKSIKGDFINVSLFTIPGRSEIAPRGLSKFTHLNDGVMDLVLVKNTERKEFIRLLKRLGNTKNQVRYKENHPKVRYKENHPSLKLVQLKYLNVNRSTPDP